MLRTLRHLTPSNIRLRPGWLPAVTGLLLVAIAAQGIAPAGHGHFLFLPVETDTEGGSGEEPAKEAKDIASHLTAPSRGRRVGLDRLARAGRLPVIRQLGRRLFADRSLPTRPAHADADIGASRMRC